MGEFLPVRTIADLETLDSDEIVEGYMDAFHGEPEPGNNRSRSYWHGWRNGAADTRRIPHDDAMRELAHEIVSAGYDLTRRHAKRPADPARSAAT
jgi:hypothetical protein